MIDEENVGTRVRPGSSARTQGPVVEEAFRVDVTAWRPPRQKAFIVPPLLVFVLTLSAFLPALRCDFIRTGDYDNLLLNPSYRGFSWNNLRWMFTTFYGGNNYRPLTWISYGFDHALWGMNPLGYHLTNSLLHGLNALLVYVIAAHLLRLIHPGTAEAMATDSLALRAGAGVAALLFSIHPLRSEAVAWVSARGHLLAALFLLLTIISYLRATDSAKASSAHWVWFGAALIFYSFSILSQPSGIALPLVLLTLDFYPLRRWGGSPMQWFGQHTRWVFLEKVPFVVLAVVAGVAGTMAKQDGLVAATDLDPLRRVALIFYGLAFYAWKTVLPIGLYPSYEIRFHFDPWEWHFLLSELVVVAISVVLFAGRRRWPAAVPSVVCHASILIPYVGFVLPVIGSVEGGREVTADRYSYLAALPWSILAGACLRSLWQALRLEHRGVRPLIFTAMPVVAIVLTMSGLTWRQTQFWQNSYTLRQHAVEVSDHSYSKSSIAHDHLGVALAEQGKFDQAIAQFHEAMRISPFYAQPLNNLGAALGKEQRFDEAIAVLSEAVRIAPNYQQAHNNLGLALARQGKLDEAIVQYSEALRIDPNYAEAQNNLRATLAVRALRGSR